MTTRIAINGFGPTGRAPFRIIEQRQLDIEVVAINDQGSASTLGRLLARDSVFGPSESTSRPGTAS